MKAHLRVIQGGAKSSIWNRLSAYRAKVAIPNDGFMLRLSYIGPWNGWKQIDPGASVISWRSVR